MKGSPCWILLKKGEYLWCKCGRSAKHPFCDGSHPDEVQPFKFRVDLDEERMICGCSKTKRPPFCDGSHSSKR